MFAEGLADSAMPGAFLGARQCGIDSQAHIRTSDPGGRARGRPEARRRVAEGHPFISFFSATEYDL